MKRIALSLPVQHQIPLAPLNTWRIGGNAKFFFQPRTPEQLIQVLQEVSPNFSKTLLGLGSNVLIRDGGIDGLVIHTRFLDTIGWEDGRIYAQAGVTCAKLAKFCCRHDCIGGEFFAGIPGTVGGALAMNAGAFGAQTWEVVQEVITIDQQGTLNRRTPQEYKIGYRTVEGNSQEMFLGAYFYLPQQKGEGEKAAEHIRALLRKRNETQPIGTFNCGSVFRNPQGDFAARLIEQSNLKGYRIGGATVSEKHANFILNVNHATSEDIESLIHLIQQTVYEQHGIRLVPEVHIIGQKEHSCVNPNS